MVLEYFRSGAAGVGDVAHSGEWERVIAMVGLPVARTEVRARWYFYWDDAVEAAAWAGKGGHFDLFMNIASTLMRADREMIGPLAVVQLMGRMIDAYGPHLSQPFITEVMHYAIDGTWLRLFTICLKHASGDGKWWRDKIDAAVANHRFTGQVAQMWLGVRGTPP